ncbi:uncharacterized protein Gasu_29330 [Galdieria sulphuraria]|uniref:AMP-activated protein kinase glycogen-binding domain-containing protein n=1 Tax=Galdieria sulphuraria TaxID=130081 RepID=M2XHY6_GALSU|nr:uncharacterized protein Gasu_29330 [Galdieria sulphuraria]EME29712.1 hypothetical protein Gasu_29330 [Galdieria sulphuraria]|eukprot:XP_005706232.1 hypothetical protein Gasu_29330 [Galdieria sulphuraria]
MAPSRGSIWNYSLLDTLHSFWKPNTEETFIEGLPEGLVGCPSNSLGDIAVDNSHTIEATSSISIGNSLGSLSSKLEKGLKEEREETRQHFKEKDTANIVQDSTTHCIGVMTEFIFDSDGCCSQIFLCGDWNNWEPIPMLMANDAIRWSIVTPVPIGYHEFGFVSDEGVWKWSRKHPWNETKGCNWRRIRGPNKSQKWKENLSPSWWTLLGCIPLFILLWILIVLERFKAIFIDDTVVLSKCDYLVNECLREEQQTTDRRNNDSWLIGSQDCIFQCALKVCKMFPRTDILMIRELHWKRLFLVAITIYTLGRFLPEILWILLR